MFLFTQLPASYKSPFSVAKDHTYEELGDIMVVSSCLSLIHMNKIQMGPQREIEYTFSSLKNPFNRTEANSWWRRRVKSGRYRVQGGERAFLPRHLFTRGASEVTTAAAALPQRPSERSSLQLRAVNSRRKTGKTYALINRCRFRMNANPFFWGVFSEGAGTKRSETGAFSLENLRCFNGLN